MKKNSIYSYVVITVFLLLMSLGIPSEVYGAQQGICRINIENGHQSMKWVLYKIGDTNTDGSIEYNERLIKYDLPAKPVSYDQLQELTEICENYLKINNASPDQSGQIDQQGKLSFTVDEGWYIIIPEKLITSEKIYTSTPTIVCVSSLEIYSEMWGEEVTIFPKSNVCSRDEFEITIPVTDFNYNQNIISEDLPQTGQLWWPVPLLALSGIIVFFSGYIIEKRR